MEFIFLSLISDGNEKRVVWIKNWFVFALNANMKPVWFNIESFKLIEYLTSKWSCVRSWGGGGGGVGAMLW